MNQNSYDILKNKEGKEEDGLKKDNPKREFYGNEKITKLENKTKKRKQLIFPGSPVGNGNHKSNLPEKKNVCLQCRKKIIFFISKKENANKKSSSKSNEFLTKKVKRNSNH